jgi:hypothetical protein
MTGHHVGVQHEEEITSEVLDELLDDAETLRVERPAGETEVRLFVPIDAGTLQELQERASAEGADLSAVAADALRAGTRAA